jgi:hypothetical protein
MTALALSFTSDIAKKQNALFVAMKRDKKTAAKVVAGITMGMAWSAGVSMLVAALLGGDDEDREKALRKKFYDEGLSLLPGGTIANRAFNPYGSAGVLDSPLTASAGSVIAGGRGLYDGMEKDDAEKMAKSLLRLFIAASDLTGAPVGNYVNAAVKAVKQWGK